MKEIIQKRNAGALSQPIPDLARPTSRFKRGLLTLATAAVFSFSVILPFNKLFAQPVPKDKNIVREDAEFKNIGKMDEAKNAEVKDGILYLKNIVFNGQNANANVSILHLLNKARLPKNAKVVLPVTKIDDEYLLIFRNLVTTVSINYQTKEMTSRGAYTSDNSMIFLSDKSYYAENGKYVYTTSTTLLIITPDKALSLTYKSLFGDVPDLKDPTITQGKTNNIVNLIDETINGPKGKMTIEINLSTLDITPRYNSSELGLK